MSDSVKTRIKRLITNDLPRISRSYTEGVSLLNLYGDDESHDDEIFACIKDCQLYLGSAIDIALRAYCIIKRIPVLTSRGYSVITASDTGDRIQVFAGDFCAAIVNFNASAESEDRLLTDVALGEFVEDRRDMNQPKHVGIVTGLKRVYRRYNNLVKVLNDIGSIIDTQIQTITDRESTFDFERFDAWMKQFDFSQRRFALIAKSMQDIPVEQLACFLQIPWSVIIDFDGASAFGGLKSCIDNVMTVNELDYTSLGPNSTYLFGNVPLYVNLHDGDFSKFIVGKGRRTHTDQKAFENMSSKIASSVYPNLTIVITGLQDERTYNLCNSLADSFSGTEIVYLSNQEEAVFHTCSSNGTGRGCIENVFFADSELCDVMRTIYDYKNILPQKESNPTIFGNGYRLPHVNSIMELSEESIHGIERYFEILHLDIGKNIEKCNESEFLHGNTASWETISNGYASPLINVKDFENEIINGSERCYYLYHLAGFGGTTHGRIISWDLHTSLPVLILHRYETAALFAMQIEYIYKIFDKCKFLIVVDENMFSQNEMIEISTKIRNNEYGIKALFVQRITRESATQRLRDNKRNEIFLTLIHKKELLCMKCYSLLAAIHQEHKYEMRKQNLENNLPARQQCPLLINLYILEENFSLQNYVSRFLEPLSEADPESNSLRRLTALISIFAYYGSCDIPTSYINRYLQITNKTDAAAALRLQPVNELLLKRNNKYSGYSTKHYLIAEEMLKQLLCSNTGFDWTTNLPMYTQEIIDLLHDICKDGKLDFVVTDIIASLFTDKSRGRIVEFEEADYTELLDAIPNARKAEVTEYLAEKIGKYIEASIPAGQSHSEYGVLAHIYAQCARIRAKHPKLDDDWNSQMDAVKKYCGKTESIITSEELYDDTLEHMLGMCLLERAHICQENEIESPDGSGYYETIITLLDEAIEHFDNCKRFGSPHYGIPQKINAVNHAIQCVKNKYHLAPDCDLEVLRKYSEIDKYIILGYEAIGEIEKIRDIDEKYQVKAITLAYNFQGVFDSICSPNGARKTLQRLEKYLSEVPVDDYHGQYTVRMSFIHNYQKKHYNAKTKHIEILSKAYAKNAEAIEDAKRVFSHLEALLKMNDRPAASFIYRMWFDYAKYFSTSLIRACDVAKEWKTVEASRNGDLLWPNYYLFVITLLLYTEAMATENDVVTRKRELNRSLPRARYISSVNDWYSVGTGMGRLKSRNICSYEEVPTDPSIMILQGNVASVSETEGFLTIKEPRAFSNWGKAFGNMTFSKDSSVFFSPGVAVLLPGDNPQIRFKLGFSFERMVASDNSLFELNVKKAVITETKKQEFAFKTIKFTATHKSEHNGHIQLIFGTLEDRRTATIHYSNVFDGRNATVEEMQKLYAYTKRGPIHVRCEKFNGKVNALLRGTHQDVEQMLAGVTDEMISQIQNQVDPLYALLLNGTFSRNNLQTTPRFHHSKLQNGTKYIGIVESVPFNSDPRNSLRIKVHIRTSMDEHFYVVSVDFIKVIGHHISLNELKALVGHEVPVKISEYKYRDDFYIGDISIALEA